MENNNTIDIDSSSFNNSRPPCPRCIEPISEGEQSLTCHGCFEELHCSCFSDPIPIEAYHILKEELSSVFIFCPNCKAKLFAKNIFDNEKPDCESRLDTLETQMTRLITMLTESTTTINKNPLLHKKNLNILTRKSFIPVNGTNVSNERSRNATHTASNRGSSCTKIPSKKRERDFGLALTGPDKIKNFKSKIQRKSPMERDTKTYSNISLKVSVNSKSVSSGLVTDSCRSQPFVIPKHGEGLVDPKVASQALKSFCFRKAKIEDVQSET